jgi:glyoxylase-like metal-dependent hydrolase (beta-lactamase superfamily II)
MGLGALVALIMLAPMTVPAATQDARAVLQGADRAIGAHTVNSVQYSGTGWLAAFGQSFATDGDWPRFELRSYTNMIDYGSRSAREEYVRAQGNYPPRGGGQQPVIGEQRFTNFVNGNYGWTLNAQSRAEPQASAAEVRQFLLWASPYGFIKAGLASADATVTDRHFAGPGRTLKVVGFTTMGKYRLTGEFNEQNLLERVVTWIPDPVMGDMQVEIRYSDYRDVGGGVKFPFHIHAHKGDHPLLPGGKGRNWFDVQISDVKVNIANAVQPVPENVRNAPAPGVPLKAERLGDNVWLMAGQTHNSVAVGFRDFVAIVESPLDDELAKNDEFSGAVIAEVKRLMPNKPIRYLVNTHHHFDHLGGVRTYAAEGAIIVTHEHNRQFLENVVLTPQSRNLSPDRLSLFPFATTGPGPIPIETVSERHAISDGQRSMLIFHVPGLNHNEEMLVAYLPQEKILINADLWGPPAPGAASSAEVSQGAVTLYKTIKRLGLDVALHVPIHGRPGPNADFERIVGPIAARQNAGSGQGG